jgi:hypothetical protein
MSEYIEQDNDPKKDELTLFVLGFLIMVIFLLSSCTTTKYVPVEKIVTKDSVIIKKEIDSVYIKVKEVVGGDTVFRDSIVYHYVLRCDTLYLHHRDSIPYPVEVVKEVERSLNKYEKTMIRLGWCLIALLVAICGWKVLKWYFKR